MTLSPTHNDTIIDKFLSIEMWTERVRILINKGFYVLAKEGLDKISKYAEKGRELVKDE